MDWATAILLALSDLPPLSDLDRFPPTEVVAAMEQWGRSYRAQRNEDRRFCSWAPGGDWGTPAYEHWAVWSSLHLAQQTHRCEYDRRKQLARLKWWIGEADYAAGVLPPAVPWQTFTRID